MECDGSVQRTFEEVETDWREALGYESNSETDDDYSTDDEDSTAMSDGENDDDEEFVVTPEEFDELAEDSRI